MTLVLAAALAGCATTANNPADPIEPFNRAIFSFNDTVDAAILKPVAKGYHAVLPSWVRTGVSNFFANIGDLWIAANNVLQGKFVEGLGDFMRLAFNTTLGLGGVIDIASDMGLQKHNEDFGQTLGRWGFNEGAYLVLPFFGPSTVRDGLARVLDWKADPVVHISNVPARNEIHAVRVVSDRSNLLDTTDVVEEAALDKYTFVRDAWLQRRRSLVYDGNPPPEQQRSESSEPFAKAEPAIVQAVRPEDAAKRASRRAGPTRCWRRFHSSWTLHRRSPGSGLTCNRCLLARQAMPRHPSSNPRRSPPRSQRWVRPPAPARSPPIRSP